MMSVLTDSSWNFCFCRFLSFSSFPPKSSIRFDVRLNSQHDKCRFIFKINIQKIKRFCWWKCSYLLLMLLLLFVLMVIESTLNYALFFQILIETKGIPLRALTLLLACISYWSEIRTEQRGRNEAIAIRKWIWMHWKISVNTKSIGSKRKKE